MYGRVMEEASEVGRYGFLLDAANTFVVAVGNVAVWRLAFPLLVFWAALGSDVAVYAVEPQPLAGVMTHLKALEQKWLPEQLTVGEARCDAIVDYYWDANPELEAELKLAKHRFRQSSPDHKRMLLVAGPAGVGKTFVKRGVYDGLSADVLWKFDARELLGSYRDLGFAEYKADLCDGSRVFNKMLTLTPAGRRHFRSVVRDCAASFVVVDSLDEIHPCDYAFVLQTLGELVHPSRQCFTQVVVFGRPFCFDAYWQWYQHERSGPAGDVQGFMLRKPEFRTTGDIQVSNWNFDCWKFGLCRKSSTFDEKFSFSDYQQWSEQGFSRVGKFSDVAFDANQHMTVEARQLLNQWIAEESTVAAVISNLAANGMVRDILVQQLQAGQQFDERVFMEQFLMLWLKRDTVSDDRPSQIKPKHLDVYLQLLENVAARYSLALDSDGCFAVSADERVKVLCDGVEVAVSVKDLLNRSGLVTADPFADKNARVRFEPLWLHRLLINKHGMRSSNGNSKQTPVALR